MSRDAQMSRYSFAITQQAFFPGRAVPPHGDATPPDLRYSLSTLIAQKTAANTKKAIHNPYPLSRLLEAYSASGTGNLKYLEGKKGFKRA
jgi:hypothetical protein